MRVPQGLAKREEGCSAVGHLYSTLKHPGAITQGITLIICIRQSCAVSRQVTIARKEGGVVNGAKRCASTAVLFLLT